MQEFSEKYIESEYKEERIEEKYALSFKPEWFGWQYIKQGTSGLPSSHTRRYEYVECERTFGSRYELYYCGRNKWTLKYEENSGHNGGWKVTKPEHVLFSAEVIYTNLDYEAVVKKYNLRAGSYPFYPTTELRRCWREETDLAPKFNKLLQQAAIKEKQSKE